MIINRCNKCGVLAVLALGVSALSASANGFSLGAQDAFATARGGAFVATADNASAVYYNPAGLTQLEGVNVRGGIYGVYLNPTFSPPSTAANSGNTYHIEDNLAAVPQVFGAYTPKDWPLSFGFGFYAPFGGNLSWPQDTGFRTVAISGSLKYLAFNPVAALKLAPGFSIAAGAMANYASLDTDQGLIGSSGPLVNYFRFKGDGWGLGYNAGLLWQPFEQVSLGATFRSSTKITMEGRTDFELQPFIPHSVRSARADFEFPWTAVLGVSYRPTPKWNLEFDANYTDWSSFGKTTIYETPAPPYPMQPNVLVTFDWKASWMYQFGVTRYFDNGWHVSAGYVFDQNSVPDAYYSPLAVDLDRHFFSIGTGFKGKRFDFDIAYQFGYGPAHTVTGSKPSSTPGFYAGENADGKYDFISHAVQLTVGMHF